MKGIISVQKTLFSLVMLTSLAVTNAFAASSTTPLTVQATVNSSCLINGSYVMDFGNITDLNTDTYAATLLPGNGFTVECTDGTDFELSANLGQNGTTGGQRRMSKGSGDYLPYNLQGSYSGIMGDGIPFFWGHGEGIGIGREIPLYFSAVIPGGTAMPPAGTYTDTVMLTVMY